MKQIFVALFLLASTAVGQDLTLKPGSIIKFNDTDSSHAVGIKGPGVVSSNINFTLPAADGFPGQVLTTNGAGAWSWANSGTGSGINDGDKGDITVSGGGAVWSIDTGAVSMTELGLSDPNADVLLFWDDSANSLSNLSLGTNLSITGTTLNVTGVSSSLNNTNVGYGNASNVLTGESEFTYDAAGNTLYVDKVRLGSGVLSKTANADTLAFIGGIGSENVVFNLAVSDTISLTSSSGVDMWDFGSLNVKVPTEVYDAAGWNGDLTVPTKDAVRDKIEALTLGNSTLTSTYVGYGDVTNVLTGEADFTYNSGTDTLKVGTLQLGSGSSIFSTATPTIKFSNLIDGEDITLAIGLAGSNTALLESSTGINVFDFGTVAAKVPQEVYDSTGWNGNLTAPTKDAVRDKVETLQPLDSDLTAIAALTTQSFGRSLLERGTDASTRTWINAAALSANTFTANQTLTTTSTPAWIVNRTGGKNAAFMAGTGGAVLSYDDTGFFGILRSTNANNLSNPGQFGTYSMYIESDGDIGIGNQAPTTKLDVTGTVKATAFVGDGSGLTGIALAGDYIESNVNIEDLSDNSLASQITFESGYVLQGPSVTSLPALVGTVMDLTEYGGVHSATSNATLTFSGSPATGQVFLLSITADGTQRTTTIPSAYSINTGANITSVVTPANTTQYLTFRRESARWVVFGDPTPVTGTGNYVLSNTPTFSSEAAPTVDAIGEIAVDNNLWAASRGAMLHYDGTAATALVGVLTSDTPSNGQVPTWNTGGSITWETPSAGPGGSSLTSTYVGYGNGSNALTGEAAFTYNEGTDTLSVTNMSISTLNTTTLVPSAIEFEGSTPDTIETSLVAANPTGTDKTITLPNADGYVTLSQGGPIGNTRIPFANADGVFTSDAAFTYNDGTDTLSVTNFSIVTLNSSLVNTDAIKFEGSTPDLFETQVGVEDPTADRTWTIPDVSDTFAGLAATQTLTNKTINLTSNTLLATSAQMRTALSDETGTGAAVFAGGNIGTATATTPDANDNDTSVATTAYVQGEIAGLAGGPSTGSFGVTVDGGGTVLTTGSKGTVIVPFACTITGWSIVADQAGSVTFDVDKAADGASTNPSVSIVASAAPALSTDQIERSTTLTGWTTAVAANDVIEFEVTGSPATITRATLQIYYTQ